MTDSLLSVDAVAGADDPAAALVDELAAQLHVGGFKVTDVRSRVRDGVAGLTVKLDKRELMIGVRVV